jgi:hypothetical protein
VGRVNANVVSRLLARSHLRSVLHRSRTRGKPVRSRGFEVSRVSDTVVEVSWRRGVGSSPEDERDRKRALEAYAATLREAGYTVAKTVPRHTVMPVLLVTRTSADED